MPREKLEPMAEIKERLLTKHAALRIRIEQIETRRTSWFARIAAMCTL